MEFSQEFIEKNQLTADQINALTTHVSNHVSELQKEWDGKANDNAERILEGAAKSVVELTGIQREKGQKIADYIAFAGEKYFEGTRNSLQTKQKELETKLQSTKGDEVLKQELAETKEKIKVLQQKEAEYDEWVKNDYKGKYEQTTQKLSVMQESVAFGAVKPNFPDTVNPYEAKAKWNDFIKATKESNDIVLDEDNEPWAVNKENTFKKTKLSDLVKQNEEIQKLLEGRSVTGLSTKDKKVKIDGVPFELKEGATPQERQKAIKEYLASQNIQITSREYSDKFKELNAKILGLEKNPASK